MLPYSVSQILDSLVEMRQACCHPQVVKGQFSVSPKVTLTMNMLLEQMIQKSRLICEESQRKIVAALNGQAACHHMQQRVSSTCQLISLSLCSQTASTSFTLVTIASPVVA